MPFPKHPMAHQIGSPPVADRSAQNPDDWQQDFFPEQRDHHAYPEYVHDGQRASSPFSRPPGALQQHANWENGRREVVVSQERRVHDVFHYHETFAEPTPPPLPPIRFGLGCAQNIHHEPLDNFGQQYDDTYHSSEYPPAHFHDHVVLRNERPNDEHFHARHFQPEPEVQLHFPPSPPSYGSPTHFSFGAHSEQLSFGQSDFEQYPEYRYRPEVVNRYPEHTHTVAHPAEPHHGPHSPIMQAPGPIRYSRKSDEYKSSFGGRRGGKEHEDAWNNRKSRASFPPRRRSFDHTPPSNRRASGRSWDGHKKNIDDKKKEQWDRPRNISSALQAKPATSSSLRKPDVKDSKKTAPKNKPNGNSQKAGTSSTNSPPSLTGNSSPAEEPMEVDDEVTYVQAFRQNHTQEKAVELPVDVPDVEIDLPDLAEVKCIIVFDTSVLLSDEGEEFFGEMKTLGNANYLYHLLFQMPCTVLEELDGLKDSKDKSGGLQKYARRSRTASKFWCDRLRNDRRFGIQNSGDHRRPARTFPLNKPDDRIVNCFLQLFDKFLPDKQVFLVTNDNNMQLKAMSNVKADLRNQIISSKTFIQKLRETLEAERKHKNGIQSAAVVASVSNQDPEDIPMETTKFENPHPVTKSLALLRQLHECLDRALLSLITVFLEKRLHLAYSGDGWKDLYGDSKHWRTPETVVVLLRMHWHAFTAGSKKLHKYKPEFESLIPTSDRITGETQEKALERRIMSRASVLHSLIKIIESYEDEELRKQYQDRMDFTKTKLSLWSGLYYDFSVDIAGAKDNIEREISTFLSTGK